MTPAPSVRSPGQPAITGSDLARGVGVSPNIEEALFSAISTAFSLTPRDTFWASSAGQCPRAQVARRAGLAPTNPPDARAYFKMGVGTAVGKWVQQALVQAKYLEPESIEQRVLYRSFSGKLDGFTKQVEGGAVVEIKTADDRAIKSYDFSENYFFQGFLYCMALNCPSLLLFQVGRNQGLSRHRVFQLTDEWRKTIDDCITEVETAWAEWEATRRLPPHAHRFSWENQTCSMLEAKEGE